MPDDDPAALNAELDRLKGEMRDVRGDLAALNAEGDAIAAELAEARLLVMEGRRLRLQSRLALAEMRATRARIAQARRRGH